MRFRTKFTALLFAALTTCAPRPMFAQERMKPFLGPDKPQYVETLVPGMGLPTLQPTLETFLGRDLAGKESNYISQAIANGERTATQVAKDILDQAAAYCALQPATAPCKDGSYKAVAQAVADRYMAYIVTQPLSAFIQGASADLSLAGTVIIHAPPPPPPTLAVIGDCFVASPTLTMCYAPGALAAGLKDGQDYVQTGRHYLIHITRNLTGPSAWGEPKQE